MVSLIQSTNNETLVKISGFAATPHGGSPHDTIPTITYSLASFLDTRAPPESPYKMKIILMNYRIINVLCKTKDSLVI